MANSIFIYLINVLVQDEERQLLWKGAPKKPVGSPRSYR